MARHDDTVRMLRAMADGLRADRAQFRVEVNITGNEISNSTFNAEFSGGSFGDNATLVGHLFQAEIGDTSVYNNIKAAFEDPAQSAELCDEVADELEAGGDRGRLQALLASLPARALAPVVTGVLTAALVHGIGLG